MAERPFSAHLRLSCFLLLFPMAATAGATGFVTYGSTPLSPPVEFLWVLPAFGAAFFVLDGVLLRKLNSRSWKTAFPLSAFLLALSLGMFAILPIGTGGTGASSGWVTSFPVEWGRRWGDSREFIRDNGLVLISLLPAASFLWLISGSIRKSICLLGANVVLYVVFLVPFFASGAFVHGWAGPFVALDCIHDRAVLARAVSAYAADQGRFPTATGIDELVGEISPYVDPSCRASIEAGKPRFRMCPKSAVFRREPEGFRLNPEFSGRRPRDGGPPLAGKLIILCPEHGGIPSGSLLLEGLVWKE